MLDKIKNQIPLLLLLLLSALSFVVLLKPGYFPMHDDQQAIRLLEMDKCIKDGQIPCRWVPDLGYGYGYPQFNYYGPLPYYVMEVFHLAGLGFLDSVKAGFIISVIFSAIGMYLLGKALWGKWGGFLSGFIYAFIPYRAVDMYVRGAVGEFWAMSLLPFVFLFILEIFKGKKKAIVGLGISIAFLITSHNITTFIFVPVAALWVLFLVYKDFGSLKQVLLKTEDLLLGIFLGFLLSAYFLLPVILEEKFAHIETLTMGYFNYLAHFVSLNQLLFSNFWAYGTSEIGPYDNISFAVGILVWVLPLLFLVLAALLKKKETKTILFFVLTGWLALFFTHAKSSFIWKIVPTLSYIQFPWRFLILAVFCFSVAIGSLTIFFEKNPKLIIYPLSAIVIITILFNSAFFKPSNWFYISDSEKFSGKSWNKQITSSIFDYLPIYAKYPPAAAAPDKLEIISGKAKIIDGQKGTNWQRWKIEATTDSEIRLSLFDYPGWKVFVDNKNVSINHNNELGLITFSVPSGDHEIYVKLTRTPIRTIGEILSIIGIAGTLIFVVKFRK